MLVPVIIGSVMLFKPTAEQNAIGAAIAHAAAKLRRWAEALERGPLSLEDAAQRIRNLHQEKDSLLKTQSKLEQRSRSMSEIRTIPTELTDTYIKEMQKRPREQAVGSKKEFMKKIIREVRVRGKDITLTYRLLLAPANILKKGR